MLPMEPPEFSSAAAGRMHPRVQIHSPIEINLWSSEEAASLVVPGRASKIPQTEASMSAMAPIRNGKSKREPMRSAV